MSNNWDRPPSGYQSGENNNKVPHTGGLLPDYNQQQSGQPIKQFSPLNAPRRQSEPLPSRQLQPGQGNVSQVPGSGRVPTQGLLTSARGQGLFGNAMQMVRQISGKVVAVNRQQMVAPPDPLIRYHPTGPGMSGPLPKAKPWKRSSTVRLAMRMRHRRMRTGEGGKRIGIGALIALIALIIISASSGTAYGYAYYQSQQPQLQGIASKQISQVTRIYDRNGVLLANISDPNGPGRRTSVSYEQVPQVMRDAMIAAEDPTFWDNGGVDPQGLLRAIVYGGSHGGGSTITQQLIKNMRGNGDQITPQRKLSEAALAIGMTQQYPKDKILEMYLNVSPFGATELGVESASEDYFGLTRMCDKNFNCTPAVSQLDYNPANKTHSPLLALARASLLAAMPNNPSLFDPGAWSLNSTNKNMALGRQIYVLQSMLNMGVLEPGLGPNGQPGPVTPAIMQQVEKMTLAMKFHSYQAHMKDPDFVLWVENQLEVALGNGDAGTGATILLNGGFNIRTTIDSSLEDYVERAVTRHLTQPEYQKLSGYTATLNSSAFNVNDAAVVVMNSKTGEVLAMDGSSNYQSTDQRVAGQENMAVLPRQPGSTFKPLVYSTAFEMGWYPGMVLPDQQTFFPNGASAGTLADKSHAYVPTDYGNTYHNISTAPIRLSTANSFNIPALRALAFTGVDNVVTTAQRMGITDINQKVTDCQKANQPLVSCIGTSLALGTSGVSPLQMVNAYQTLSDNGQHVPTQGILDIWDNYGHNFYHFDPNHVQSAQVLSPQVSYMMTSVLDDEASRSLEFESDHDLSFWDWDPTCSYVQQCQQHEVAAKTGTTDDFKDNWTIGYTPDVTVGVWTGNANDEAFGQSVIGITGAAPIWHSIIERVSGKCNVDTDNISCGNINLKALGLGSQTLFTVPSGIQKQCVNNTNGLMGAGGDCDWIINGQQPVQTGLLASDLNGGNGNRNNNGGGSNNGNGGKKNGG
jgi:membrane peptidoglycan carboxypeptidase